MSGVVDPEAILAASSPDGDPEEALVCADHFLEQGDLRLAASALDRAWGLRPDDEELARRRRGLLDELAVTEHGLTFRYVPAGSFLMGSTGGEPDERPVHAARLAGFWVSETPVTWAAFCDLRGWLPPPQGVPENEDSTRDTAFQRREERKIRLQYCETQTRLAGDWHAHDPLLVIEQGEEPVPARELFGEIPRDEPGRPFQFNVKPLVSVSWIDAEAMCSEMTGTQVAASAQVVYGLPTEAQWERAARGGRIGARYSWGDALPDNSRCDFDHFGRFTIRPPKTLPPNDYGLYGMCGGVWEWTADDYDALAYRNDAPPAPADRTQVERVLRGGSWADCADVVTVSYRMSRPAGSGVWGAYMSPNVGFRILRMERPES